MMTMTESSSPELLFPSHGRVVTMASPSETCASACLPTCHRADSISG